MQKNPDVEACLWNWSRYLFYKLQAFCHLLAILEWFVPPYIVSSFTKYLVFSSLLQGPINQWHSWLILISLFPAAVSGNEPVLIPHPSPLPTPNPSEQRKWNLITSRDRIWQKGCLSSNTYRLLVALQLLMRFLWDNHVMSNDNVMCWQNIRDSCCH